VRGPQDQHQRGPREPGGVQEPARRLPDRGAPGGAPGGAVDLVTQPGVPVQQGPGRPERAQLAGGRRGGGEREQLAQQPPRVGEVVVVAFLDLPGRRSARPGAAASSGTTSSGGQTSASSTAAPANSSPERISPRLWFGAAARVRRRSRSVSI
jgi:hypothetical protein